MNRAPYKIVAVLALLPLASCVTVKTPEKPIEINLNVKIEQEVLVRLQRDVDTLIKSNPDAFPTKPSGNPQ
ncbi:YnbE family lipoprotein [Sphingomonas sp.]|uniref:YnbE family lipoprotein n=1 Tax=Sphingomonas sp. TaxID=28214 RepID=UPI00286B1A0F|nr:YnbE family lipoprotein [Sphingomonas sp.]